MCNHCTGLRDALRALEDVARRLESVADALGAEVPEPEVGEEVADVEVYGVGVTE